MTGKARICQLYRRCLKMEKHLGHSANRAEANCGWIAQEVYGCSKKGKVAKY
jgi:hypothetical protein